ncbi:phytanoyl-CoA dioxygenase [Schizophyllum amplum]|uniref:Phytanoyl-CoA dioxygenase n=1 Tax=Schizophyllum amplum TaxID=97359 RepID=A0A550CWW1_9AGAR|nr:phytanoyl-CoA dioxygenase [Auriculariopsis ampla]
MAAHLKYLTQEQIDKFYKDGYLVIPKLVDTETTQALLARSKELLDELNVEEHPMTRFTTGEDNHVGDDYFLSSGDKIRYFFEEDAVVNGRLNRPKQRAVNKFGHGLHLLDPLFRRVTLENDALRDVVCDLKFHREPVALQSMVITKQPQIGGEVGEHNDSTFLYTSPPTALGIWIALERCTAANGALSFLPGSHSTLATTPGLEKSGGISKRFVRLRGGGTGFEKLGEEAKVEGEYALVECEPGDTVLIHGTVLHKSPRNTGADTRFAYTFHMIDAASDVVYDDKNWLQPGEDGFAKVL